MERYEICSIESIKCVRLILEHYRSYKRKEYLLHQEEYVSILYIDNLNNIGEGKEYQIDGRVINIKQCSEIKFATDNYNIMDVPNCIATNLKLNQKNKNNTHRVEIILDCGNQREAKVLCLNSCNILDIEKFPYKFNLDENPEPLPKVTDGFVVNEMKTPQQIDVGMNKYNPLSGLNDKIFGRN